MAPINKEAGLTTETDYQKWQVYGCTAMGAEHWERKEEGSKNTEERKAVCNVQFAMSSVQARLVIKQDSDQAGNWSSKVVIEQDIDQGSDKTG